jgi:hypothetical protein
MRRAKLLQGAGSQALWLHTTSRERLYSVAMLATPHASCCFGLLPTVADYLFGPLKSLMLPSSGKAPTMRVIQPFEVGPPKMHSCRPLSFATFNVHDDGEKTDAGPTRPAVDLLALIYETRCAPD